MTVMTLSGRLVAMLVPLVLATGTAAQPHGTDLFLLQKGSLLRLPTAGAVTTILRNGFEHITVDGDNRHVVVAISGGPGTVLRVEPEAGVVVATVWTGPPLGQYLYGLDLDQDGDYLVAKSAPTFSSDSVLLKIKRDGSRVTTICAIRRWPGILCFSEDRSSGDWILGTWRSSLQEVVHVDRGSGGVTTLVPLVGSISMRGLVSS